MHINKNSGVSGYKPPDKCHSSTAKKSENLSNFSPDENTKSYFSSSKKSSLPPLGVYQSANKETLADLESVNKKITELSENNNQCTNDIFALMALFAKIGLITKKSAYMQREFNSQRDINSQRASKVEMVKAAAAKFAAGLTSGLLQGGGACLQIGLSGSALNQTAKGATFEKSSHAPEFPGGRVKSGTSEASLLGQKYNSWATASGTLGSAASTIGSTSANSFADAAEQRKFDREIEAKIFATATSRADDAYRAATELNADSQAKMRDINAATTACNNTFIRNI